MISHINSWMMSLSLPHKCRGKILFLVSILFIPACTPLNLDEISFPEVETGSFELTSNGLPEVRLAGIIKGMLADEKVENCGHIWAATPNLSPENNLGETFLEAKGNGEFQSNLKDLTPGRTYYYQAFIQYQGEVKYGVVESFMLDPLSPQVAIDNVLMSPTHSFATVNYTISGLIQGIRLESFGLTWSGSDPMPIFEEDQIAPEFGVRVSEAEFSFESTITLNRGLNYLRPYVELGDSTIYGPTQMVFRGNFWTQRADFEGVSTSEAVRFSIGNKAYIGTGRQTVENPITLTIEEVPTEDFWEYDSQTEAWTQRADFAGAPRTRAVGFAIGDKGYVGTGFGSSLFDLKKDFWEYDPQTDMWAQRADFEGISRYEAIGFSIGNKGYLGTGTFIGGDDFRRIPTIDFWEYDPQTDAWARRADFAGGPRARAVGFSIGNKGYVGIGLGEQDFWEYDPQTDMWAQRADFEGGPRNFAVGFSIGNKGYLGTGDLGTGDRKQDFWAYDPALNTWTQFADVGNGLELGVGFSIENKGYIKFDNSNNLWEYTPIPD